MRNYKNFILNYEFDDVLCQNFSRYWNVSRTSYGVLPTDFQDKERLKLSLLIENEWMGILDTPFILVFVMFFIILQNKGTLMMNRTV